MKTKFLIPILLIVFIFSLTACTTPKTKGKIAFVSNRDGNTEIYIMNVDGSEQTNLTNNPAPDGFPSFSPF